MHIGLPICHFLLSTVSIPEGPKNKIMRKSGIHSSGPCRDRTLKQFSFCWVNEKVFFQSILGQKDLVNFVVQKCWDTLFIPSDTQKTLSRHPLYTCRHIPDKLCAQSRYPPDTQKTATSKILDFSN